MPKNKTDSHLRIIDAARNEFLVYGYNDASLRRIAENAHIQVSGLYKHFPSKKEMFTSLVEPAVKGFYDLYHKIENEYFCRMDQTDDDYVWEGENEVTRFMSFIYDNLEEFKLLVLHSEGTGFEDFIHEAAKLEEEVTLRYLKELKEKGAAVRDVDPMEMHLLTSAYVESVFQPVIHGLDREKAMHYAATLQEFYEPAWKAFLGI